MPATRATAGGRAHRARLTEYVQPTTVESPLSMRAPGPNSPMKESELHDLGRHLLDRLEAEESKLLAWGIVDGAFTRVEVLQFATMVLRSAGMPESDAEMLVTSLLDRRLLFRLESLEPKRFRTRMAETVRLARRLRQWFPNGTPNDRSWETAPTLVSDYRFSLFPRRYPVRNVTEAAVRTALTSRGVNLSPQSSTALAALLQDGGGRMLSKFQTDSAVQILSDLGTDKSGAVIVGAGTGTGKTLAFYLPAILHLVNDRSKRRCAPVLALYPRNELLKDQFAAAFDEVRRIDPTLEGKRRILLGIWNSYTPKNAADVLERASWKVYRSTTGKELGRICPYFTCPTPGCDGVLVWSKVDLEQQIHRLTCSRCERQISQDEVLLTREQILNNAPDILFTTAESLNRLMFRMDHGSVIGLNVPSPPRLVLLDEVHTYDASLGAHVACLLRRWRHAIGWNNPIEFVGLSATLRNPADFFSDLVGAPTGNVVAIQPASDDLAEATGYEYRLALRGDPFSGAALLATTIQTTMLIRRALDPEYQSNRGPSKGLYGRQVFVFTDTLDLANRLYHSLRDAERQGLAGLRVPTADPYKDSSGQSWGLCSRLGFSLVDPRDPNADPRLLNQMRLTIGRTSSQDAGVDSDADAIIATSSLEVGYDSPEVGAVLQHKAPRSAASFLQRLGRAGRPPKMRPWKVAVLSDYGRDRLAYHAHDTLFEPELKPHAVAHRNRYILRIQAAFAFMDWLAKIERQRLQGTVWTDLSRPHSKEFTHAFPRQARLAQVIEDVLLGNNRRREALTEYLAQSLRLDDDQLFTVLFEPPRALLTAVLPTALRRLRSGWTRAWDTRPDYQEDDHPLPEFVPGELFSDLNLPEVAVLRPVGNDLLERLGVAQAMALLAPGNVTKRFAPFWATGAHWIPAESGPLDVSTFLVRDEELEPVQYRVNGQPVSARCCRPWVVRVQETPPDLMPTSRGFLDWHCQLAPTALPAVLPPATTSRWRHLICGVYFCTHQAGKPARVRRFSLGGRASLARRIGKQREDVSYSFIGSDGTPVALGLELEVDALALRLRIPPELLTWADGSSECKRTLRPLFFRHLLQTSDRLDGIANRFQRDRLSDLLLSALFAWAVRTGLDLKGAGQDLAAKLVPTLERTLEVIFQSLPLDETGSQEDDATDGDQSANNHGHASANLQKAATDVLDLVRMPAVQGELLRLMPVLWGELPPDVSPAWKPWLSRCFRETLGCALVEACRGMCPQYDAGELYLDVDEGEPIPGCADFPGDGCVTLWITEPLPGGSGLIEALHTAYAADPGRFSLLLDAALAETEYEIADVQLTRITELTFADSAVSDALKVLRSSSGHHDLYQSSLALFRLLSARGVLLTHAVRSGLMARLCRPGSSVASDALVRQLLQLWRSEENRLGVELDIRTFAFVASRNATIRASLQAVAPIGVDPNDESWKFSQILAMLWPRGHATRSLHDEHFNPFAVASVTDRLLAHLFACDSIERVDINQPEWLSLALSRLSVSGAVELAAPLDGAPHLAAAIVTLAALPVECDTLRFYAQLDGVRLSSGGPIARIRVRELG